MNFRTAAKKASNKENASLKSILVVDGQYDKGAIMREAWKRARRLAELFGTSAKAQLAKSLKETWAIAKA